jgi:hypothetical protein
LDLLMVDLFGQLSILGTIEKTKELQTSPPPI